MSIFCMYLIILGTLKNRKFLVSRKFSIFVDFVRMDVLRRDKYRCSIRENRFRRAEPDVDHIIPVQMGGNFFEKANLRTLYKECHKLKSKLDSEALSDL